MAIGKYDSSLYLIGGIYNDNQMAEFQINSKTFIDRGLNAIPKEHYGFSQYYTQINNILYMIDPADSMINVYFLNNQTLVTNFSAISINVGQYGCLTSSLTQLFVIGGAELSSSPSLDSIQILNLQTDEWKSGPKLLQARERFSCIMHPTDSSVLFAFGGENNVYGYLKSSERINLATNSAEYIDDLSVPVLDTRAINYNGMIYVIGGLDNLANFIDLVHIISPNDGVVTVSDDRLAHGVYGVAAIEVDGTFYAFGGLISGFSLVDTWMEYSINTTTTFSTREPTSQSAVITATPTINPSNQPSANPTLYPSDDPTIMPTIHPTQYPSTPSTDAIEYILSFQMDANATTKDIEKVVWDTLSATYDAVLLKTTIDSNNKVVILMAIKSESDISTELIQSEIGEALEIEYGEDIEVTMYINDGQSDVTDIDNGDGVDALFIYLSIVSAILFVICAIAVFIYVLRQKRKSKTTTKDKEIIDFTPERVGSISSNVSMQNVEMKKDMEAQTTKGIDTIIYGTNHEPEEPEEESEELYVEENEGNIDDEDHETRGGTMGSDNFTKGPADTDAGLV